MEQCRLQVATEAVRPAPTRPATLRLAATTGIQSGGCASTLRPSPAQPPTSTVSPTNSPTATAPAFRTVQVATTPYNP